MDITGLDAHDFLITVADYSQAVCSDYKSMASELKDLRYTPIETQVNSLWPKVSCFAPVPANSSAFFFNPDVNSSKRQLRQNYDAFYLEQRSLFDQFLQHHYKDPELQQRVTAVNKIIKVASNVKTDGDKGAIISAFVNMTFNYDFQKRDIDSSLDPNDPYYFKKWSNPPQETIIKNKAVCTGLAILKAEMMLRAGIAPEKIALFTLETKETAHQVAGIITDSNRVLIYKNYQMKSVCADEKKFEDTYKAGAVPIDGNVYFSKESGNKLVSAMNMNEEVIMYKSQEPITLANAQSDDKLFQPNSKKAHRQAVKITKKLYKAQNGPFYKQPSSQQQKQNLKTPGFS